MNILYKYNNGNTVVTIMDDGTKIREYDSEPKLVHPESIDCKITNWCDMGCKYCHEMSNLNGKHADLVALLNVLSDLPAGVELAVGGGNPLSHPNIASFLYILKTRDLIANVTVNAKHIRKHYYELRGFLTQNLIRGFGISYSGKSQFEDIKGLFEVSDNIVFHLVMGVNTHNDIQDLFEFCLKNNKTCKVLVLGYKQFGSGIAYYKEHSDIEDNKYQWYINIAKFFKREGLVLSFDNLALEQLHLKRFFTDKAWDKFFMGKDGYATCYIDAVNQCYGVSSTSINRVPFNKKSLIDFFTSIS